MPLDGFKPISSKYPLLDMRDDECRWPYGDIGDRYFHFCRRGVAPGKSYCPLHVEVSLIPKEEIKSELAKMRSEVSKTLVRINTEEEKKQNGR